VIHVISRIKAKCISSNNIFQGSPCTIFNGTKTKDGYGETTVQARKFLVHRVVYEHLKGPIPESLQVDHLCRNRQCCNIDHLELVTSRENTMRGLSPSQTKARAASITHCPAGHEYSEENTAIYFPNNRHCRTCTQIRSANRSKSAMRNTRPEVGGGIPSQAATLKAEK